MGGLIKERENNRVGDRVCVSKCVSVYKLGKKDTVIKRL